jgi:hypothetical protein
MLHSLHLRDLGKGRRFRYHWPQIDTRTWPGRELYWAYTHPAMALLIILVSVIVLGGSVNDVAGGP